MKYESRTENREIVRFGDQTFELLPREDIFVAKSQLPLVRRFSDVLEVNRPDMIYFRMDTSQNGSKTLPGMYNEAKEIAHKYGARIISTTEEPFLEEGEMSVLGASCLCCIDRIEYDGTGARKGPNGNFYGVGPSDSRLVMVDENTGSLLHAGRASNLIIPE